MDFHAVCCTLLLLTSIGVCFGQELILPDSIIRAVGQDVEIRPTRIPESLQFIRWSVNTTSILFGPPSGVTINPPYTGRASLVPSTLTLELKNLSENDTGQYSLEIQTIMGPVTGQTSLHVLVPVSNVTIVPSQTELFEFNSTVSLVCSASGSSLSFIWLNSSSAVTADERIQLTDNNSSLSITSVIRGDTGPYRCEASNMLGKNMSPELSLIIYYGPENVAIAADTEGPIYSSGSNLTLTCSAKSNPAAEFQWAVNGTELRETSPELKLNNIQISQSGNYTCIAHNKQRYSISEPINVTVLVPVSEVSIEPSVNEVELNSTVSFVCSASGSSLSFMWLNNSFEVTAGERVQLTDNNRNMTITSVIRGDRGPYECEASNSLNKKKSLPVILTININGNEEGGGSSLSAGAIAGIVIGVLLGVAAIAGLIFYIVKDKPLLGITSSKNEKNGASPNEGQQELQYADIHHLRDNQRQPGISGMPRGPTTSQSNKNVSPAAVIYSDVRNV